MKPGKLIAAGMVAGVVSLMAATPAFASGVPLDVVLGDLAVAPQQGPGDKPDSAGQGNRPDNRPDNPGRPDAEPAGEGDGDTTEGDANTNRGNRPETAGRPDDVGPGNRNVPTLPENASPRAHAAVTAAYEQQGAIRDRIAAIQDLEKGPGRHEAMNELMAELGGLVNLVSDAVHAVEVGGGNDPGGEGDGDGDAATEGDEVAILGDSEEEDEGDNDGDADDDDDDEGV